MVHTVLSGDHFQLGIIMFVWASHKLSAKCITGLLCNSYSQIVQRLNSLLLVATYSVISSNYSHFHFCDELILCQSTCCRLFHAGMKWWVPCVWSRQHTPHPNKYDIDATIEWSIVTMHNVWKASGKIPPDKIMLIYHLAKIISLYLWLHGGIGNLINSTKKYIFQQYKGS